VCFEQVLLLLLLLLPLLLHGKLLLDASITVMYCSPH